MNGDEITEQFSDLSEMITRAQADADLDLARQLDPGVVAANKRRRRRRRVIAATITLAAVAAVSTYLPVTLLAPAPAATLTLDEPVITPPAAVAFALPDVGASAVTVMGAEEFAGTVGTDGILASSGGADQRPIASITKLVTALVILDAKPLGAADSGPTITFSKADAALYDKYYVMGATIQPMKAGSTMSEREALQVMLISSATNYAEAVSTWAFGSQANFRSAARAWLDARGLSGTTIVEPTGIDPGNVSTPTDLLALGKLALEHPVVSVIVGSPGFSLPGLSGSNTNTLIGIDGINGIKTGTLEQAGSCLLFSASVEIGLRKSIIVVGVVLGGYNHHSVDAAVRALLGSIRSGFHEVPLVTAGQRLGSYTTPWGEEAIVVAEKDASVLTWSDTPVTSTSEAKPVTTAADGSRVGDITFAAENATVTVPLMLEGDIDGPDGWWRLTHPAELLGG